MEINANSEIVCCLCGLEKADTRDHVFPRCLFSTPLPTNLPTVPACSKCNNLTSKDEEAFRVFLAAGIRAYQSKSGNQIWQERIRLDLQGKRIGLKKFINSMVKQARIVSESGNFLGYVPILEMNRESVNRVLNKIAKGLYYLDTKNPLPQYIEILLGCYEENPKILAPPLDEAIRKAKVSRLGNGEVTYWRNIIKDSPEESLTWIRFYEDKIFLICTTKKERIITQDM
jgi:hypothetical protein